MLLLGEIISKMYLSENKEVTLLYKLNRERFGNERSAINRRFLHQQRTLVILFTKIILYYRITSVFNEIFFFLHFCNADFVAVMGL